jgi:hypothetical protein
MNLHYYIIDVSSPKHRSGPEVAGSSHSAGRNCHIPIDEESRHVGLGQTRCPDALQPQRLRGRHHPCTPWIAAECSGGCETEGRVKWGWLVVVWSPPMPPWERCEGLSECKLLQTFV